MASVKGKYYPTLLRRVQITRVTSTNNRYLYSPHSSRPREADVLVCSIAVYFYSFTAILHTKTSNKIYISASLCEQIMENIIVVTPFKHNSEIFNI